MFVACPVEYTSRKLKVELLKHASNRSKNCFKTNLKKQTLADYKSVYMFSAIHTLYQIGFIHDSRHICFRVIRADYVANFIVASNSTIAKHIHNNYPAKSR